LTRVNRKISILIIFLSILVTVGLTWFSFATYRELNHLRQLEKEVFEKDRTLDQNFRSLHRALGFGGFIHNVKEYLIHRQPVQLLILEENVVEVEAAYGHIRNAFHGVYTDRAIIVLDRFIQTIRTKKETLSLPENQALPIEELDQKLALESPEILSALITLESLGKFESQKAISEIQHSIDVLTSYLVWLSLLLPASLAVGLYLAWALNRMQRTQKELSWELRLNRELIETGKALITHEQSVGQVAKKVLESVQRLTASEHGYVSEIDRETGANVGHTLTAMMGDSCTVSDEHQKISFPRDEDGRYGCLWGHALNTGEPFFTNNSKQHPEAKGLPDGHVPIERFMSVPVKYAGEVVGQIALANPLQDYTEDHLGAVQRLSDLYAIAIHRHYALEDREQMEQQLRQSQKMEAVGTLAGGIAHDFNNLLGVIAGNFDLVRYRVQGDELVDEALVLIKEASGRAKELVAQILAFSRLEQVQKETLNVCNVMQNVLRMARSMIPTSVEFSEDLPQEPCYIFASSMQLQQVFINLFTNASHAMEGKGLLSVSVETVERNSRDFPDKENDSAGEFAMVKVVDTGSGMEKKVLQKIFDPFFTTKGVGVGTGMGLSVVHGIIEQYGGFITVDSRPGEGTTFKLYFPLVEPPEQDVDAEEEQGLPTGTESILFVDDEECIAETGEELLKFLGYRVACFSEPVQALEAFKATPDEYDLVISDQTMPKMTGIEMAAEMLKVRPDLPIILCSGYTTRDSEAEALAVGIREFCLKPMDMEKLARAVRRVLDN